MITGLLPRTHYGRPVIDQVQGMDPSTASVLVLAQHYDLSDDVNHRKNPGHVFLH